MKDIHIISLIERASTLVAVLGLCSLYVYVKWQTTDDTKTKLEITMENLMNVLQKESQETQATTEFFKQQFEDKATTLTYNCENIDVWGSDSYDDTNITIHSSRRVCMDEGVMPYQGNCIVYSIETVERGYLLAKTSFDIAASLYGCELRTFVQLPVSNNSNDPVSPSTATIGEVISLNDSKDMWLQDVALAMYQEDTIVDVVHISMEQQQWKLLLEMLEIRATRRIKQLLVSIHNYGTPHSHYLMLQALEDAGMQLFAQTTDDCEETMAPCLNSAYINSHYLE